MLQAVERPLADHLGATHQSTHGSPASDRHNTTAPRRSAHDLGWQADVDLEDGIRSTLQWIRKSIKQPRVLVILVGQVFSISFHGHVERQILCQSRNLVLILNHISAAVRSMGVNACAGKGWTIGMEVSLRKSHPATWRPSCPHVHRSPANNPSASNGAVLLVCS